jgi:hypothetical protein
MAWQRISPEVTVKSFKKCSGWDCCGMAVRRMGMLGVSVRTMKALTVKMKTSDTEW